MGRKFSSNFIWNGAAINLNYYQNLVELPPSPLMPACTNTSGLLFGVRSANEQNQHEISYVLAGILGAENISNDIVVHGADQKSHYKSLHAEMERLEACRLTLNSDKCQYNMDRIIFMGMLLPQKGIELTMTEWKL